MFLTSNQGKLAEAKQHLEPLGFDVQQFLIDGKVPAITEPQADSLEEAILDCYDVALDDQRLREGLRGLKQGSDSIAMVFDRLRKDYPMRREFSAYMVDYAIDDPAQYQSLGFKFG
jgi:3-deoxy-D-manno-octulosonate 8-phosphate phosphatase KdsC-like HAD superfamily phosphatase